MHGLACAPWSLVPPATLAPVHGVLTDIDDTLTTGGAITPDALAALVDLEHAGIPVVAITGRPMGWCEPFARDWPVAAIVAENGAVALFREAGRTKVEYAQGEAERARNTVRLRAAAARILREVPDSRLARDSAGRVTDIAIDHGEFNRLDAPQIEQVLALMHAEGMHASVSSIHVNGWFGEHDKASGAAWIVRRLWARELAAERERWVYVGDSTNDQALFAQMPLSVGVANLLNFADRLQCWPAYLTTGERGAGFAEVARTLLAR